MFRVLGLFPFSSCGDEKRLHKTTQYILLPTCCVREEEEEEEDMATAHDKKRATAIISILLISRALVAGVSIALAERRNNRFKSIIGEETTTRSSHSMFRILRAKRTPFLKGWKRRKKEERGLFDVIEDDQMGAPKIVRLEEEEEEEEKEEEESL